MSTEAEELLGRLVRFNTVNPPGNEREAQEYLADHLRQAGFECELLGAEPGRPNLLARLRPYRSGDDRISGIVLTFVDISERRRVSEAKPVARGIRAAVRDVAPLQRDIKNVVRPGHRAAHPARVGRPGSHRPLACTA